MKKISVLLISVAMLILLITGCKTEEKEDLTKEVKEQNESTSTTVEKESEEKDLSWEPSKNINFFVASSPGGGSDMYSRSITDIIAKKGLIDKTIIVSNETDGGGSVIRNKVANMKDDHTLLAFVSGAIRKMHSNEDITITMDDFTPIAILAADKHLFFISKDSPYTTIEEVLDALKSGKKVVMGGSKSDDQNIYEAFIKEIGVDKDTLTYITYDSSGEAIVSLLGGHIDFCISKPGAALEYVKSGDLSPILALSTSRFPSPLDQAPILSELGYNDIEIPTWRGVVGPKDMSPEAAKYWSDIFKEAAKTEEWKEYMDNNLLISMYMDMDEAKEYIKEYEQQIIDSLN